jgi:predicted HTH transcriptional regulator
MTYYRFGDEEIIPIVKYGHERPDLDYKGSINWDEWPNSDKADLVRDMIALANSEVPGYIVIGASDEGGVVRSYDGLSDKQIESFDPSKIADKVKRYADPEIHFDLYKPTVDGKRYVVIRVSPFQTVPHVCRTNYANILEEAAIYVRGEGARTIKVPSAEHMRQIVDRAIQISADTLVNRIRRLVSALKEGELAGHEHFESQIAEVRKQLEKKFG